MVRYLVGSVGASLLAGCYAPTPQAGSPCPTGACPSGFVCSPVTETCEREDRDAGAPFDAGPDAGIDGCYGTGLAIVCPDNPITGQQLLTVTTSFALNTDTAPQCVPYRTPDGRPGTAYCVVAAKSITVTATGRVIATGSRPLVLLATNTLLVEGTIDASSKRTGQVGAGADPAGCVAGVPATGTQGGAGGSLGSVGGAGGRGAGDAALAPAGAPVTATELRGGCRGGDGAGAQPGTGGRGGGAVYLISPGSIAIGGTINASGAAGSGAMQSGGGGGGGAGGMIGFDAPALFVTGRVFANGGGGGEGAGANAGIAGADPTSPTAAAAGGAGGAAGGGNGGDGAVGGIPANAGASDTAAGGGGGGGVGVIRVFPPQPLTGSISPPPA